MKLFNKDIKKHKLLEYIGSIEQIAGVREYRLSSGKADGVKCLDIRNGTGLSFTIIPDRGMDISNAEYMGTPLAWISKNRVVSSRYFETEDMSFLRNFTGGLLTTCGLTHVGEPCIDEGEKLGLHGRIANTPAERYNIMEYWEEDDYTIEIVGYIRQTRLYGENILLIRSIKCKMSEPKIIIKDRIINEGYEEIPLMVLYHCNFGYPIVSENSKVYTSATETRPENDQAKEKDFKILDIPKEKYEYELYRHMDCNNNKFGWGAVYNQDINLGSYVKYNKENFKYLFQWKMLGKQDYVIALEPANCLQEGRAQAKTNNRVTLLNPGEEKTFNIEIGVIKDIHELKIL